MYLLDTNSLLELLLDQDEAGEVEKLLRSIPGGKLHISGLGGNGDQARVFGIL
ncbi:hypothetical protein [Thermodesulforhabdus norvegica]|uniref:Uncharacterized protein n=1 Tax=Thermodesulforhabdus norvegica TaxID=39841 RepID=A0A1I4TUF0_9BACT|nr:hypothetical protein [Thermodesulforhabdus norvegica]SFM80197.1 hypothetical protein SAMN05660836_01525 [Thermodesulforhabdus norvegica]